MKQLTMSTGQIFGPFESIEIQEDRYHTATVDFPFTVVGNDCVIGEYVAPVEPEVIEAQP